MASVIYSSPDCVNKAAPTKATKINIPDTKMVICLDT